MPKWQIERNCVIRFCFSLLLSFAVLLLCWIVSNCQTMFVTFLVGPITRVKLVGASVGFLDQFCSGTMVRRISAPICACVCGPCPLVNVCVRESGICFVCRYYYFWHFASNDDIIFCYFLFVRETGVVWSAMHTNTIPFLRTRNECW